MAERSVEDEATIVFLFLRAKPNKELYKNLKQDVKKVLDMMLQSVCKGYVASPEYKSGLETPNYKVCCEIVDYCSFYYQTWFYLVCTAAGCILLNIIYLVVVYMICRNRGPGGGGATPKSGKSTGKMPGANKTK